MYTTWHDRALGGYVRGHAQTQVALRDGLLISVYPRPAEFTAGDSPGGMAKVPPYQRRSTLSAAPIRATSVKRAYGPGPVTPARAVGLG